MVGGAKRKMSIAFGGRIQGASEVEKFTAEVEKYHLMEATVTGALREARTNQQNIRNKINAMVDDSHATELRELKAEKKQVGLAHKKAMEVVAGLEEKLDEVRLSAQDAIRALDAADRTLGSSKEAHETAKAALEAASPEHLRERMHAANLLALKPRVRKRRPRRSLPAAQAIKPCFSAG